MAPDVIASSAASHATAPVCGSVTQAPAVHPTAKAREDAGISIRHQMGGRSVPWCEIFALSGWRSCTPLRHIAHSVRLQMVWDNL